LLVFASVVNVDRERYPKIKSFLFQLFPDVVAASVKMLSIYLCAASCSVTSKQWRDILNVYPKSWSIGYNDLGVFSHRIRKDVAT